jgi:PAS domain S-box-containing protein
MRSSLENLEGVILAWNSAAERMFGYAADEAIGQSIAIVVSGVSASGDRDPRTVASAA